MKVGAVIAAAGMSTRMKQFKQMMRIGSLTMAERVVINFQRAGITDIVMVTGYRGSQLRKSLEYLGITFVENTEYEHTEMFDSVKLGLEHFAKGYDRVLFCPADIPFFTGRTVDCVLRSTAKIVIPRCGGRSGHPIAIDGSLVPGILAYRGDRGLKGAIEASGEAAEFVEVDDPGALMDADTREDFQRLVELHNGQLLKPTLKLGIATGRECFRPETAEILRLIRRLGSVKEACRAAGISYSKGWAVIALAEEGLGYRIVERVPGGRKGGEAYLTEKGEELLDGYTALDAELQEIVKKRYSRIFSGEEP